jgi:iron(III) transport system ATP-binding protein
MIAVTIRDLSKHFGDHLVLDHINLRIEPGELFFLLGPSGCGKTTLLRHIAGFYFPDQGEILFDDQDVSRVPPHKRGTGMMFQSYALWPHLTVAGNVAFGLEERHVARPEIKQRVDEALGSVGMSTMADRKINELSGGQQQRVALARALVIRPRCLLLDEPLSNLDARMRLQMRGEIRRVCKQFGLTAIYVTHDQKEALSIADRLAVLDEGHLAQVGTPREIYRRPVSRAVADFIGETNFLHGTALAPGQEADQWRVRTELGEFTGLKADRGWDLHAGEPVVLSVRPESWKLQASAERDAPGSNVVAGRIGRRVYLGELAEYDFQPRLTEARGSAALKVYELNPRFLETPEDAEIAIHAAPEDVIVLHP